MEQRRFIRKLLLFAVLTALAYPAYLVVWSLLLPNSQLKNVRYYMGSAGHMHTRIQELKEHPPVDVVFLGSSHTYRSFDPRIWASAGCATFNLGSSSQSPVQTELMVQEYLTVLKPKLVIYEVYGLLANMDGVESALDLIANRPIDMATVKMALPIRNAKVYNSLIYSYIRQWSGQDKNFVEPLLKENDEYIKGGYVKRIDPTFSAEPPPKSKHVKPLEFQWEAFERTLAFLKERGYKVLLIRTPTTNVHYDHTQIMSPELVEFLEKQPNYLDMNSAAELTGQDLFYDRHHLNSNGVAAFNAVLLDTLQTLGYLPLER